MNVELLLKVKEAILEEPKRIDMDTWANEDETVPCGTVGCIYGWGQALATGLRGIAVWDFIKKDPSYKNIFGVDIPTSPQAPFDLTFAQAQRLYYVNHWPARFRAALNRHLEQTPEYAQVVADRIDHFIKTGGEE